MANQELLTSSKGGKKTTNGKTNYFFSEKPQKTKSSSIVAMCLQEMSYTAVINPVFKAQWYCQTASTKGVTENWKQMLCQINYKKDEDFRDFISRITIGKNDARRSLQLVNKLIYFKAQIGIQTFFLHLL